jgi:hypothetical protein
MGDHVLTTHNIVTCQGKTLAQIITTLAGTAGAATVATAIVATGFVGAIGDTGNNTLTLFTHGGRATIRIDLALLTGIQRAVAAELYCLAISGDAAFSLLTLATDSPAAVIAAGEPSAIGLARPLAQTTDAFLFITTHAATAATPVVATLEAFAGRKALDAGRTIASLTGRTGTIARATATVLIAVARHIPAEGVGLRAPAATIYALTSTDIVPQRITAECVHRTDTGFAGTAATPRTVQGLTALHRRQGTIAIIAKQPLGALATHATTTVWAAVLSRASRQARNTLTLNALLTG